ncbi:M3 family oligoendopeptidase [Bacillus massiliglaciei]|uniref:M3 family oligoendopeptidase n=1 Tax=Bacillus massiliglaciei TaxID=1816693 RepID=UPI000A8F3F1B|nr:M3 family oligoendopeptidase [Bacillus massiliglaciei]
MKFSEYEYKRPNFEEVKRHFQAELQYFKKAENVEDQVAAMKKINDLRNNVSTMFNIGYIRHSIDTNNDFYKAENDFFDEFGPEVENLTSLYYKELVKSKYRKQLEEKWGRQLFALAEAQLKTFSPEIIPLLQKENKLSSEYSQLIASAKIEFEEEERTLAQLVPFMEDSSRKMRKKAHAAYFGFLEEKTGEVDRIFDELVKVRHEIAQTLGYRNFIELGYCRMARTDYDAEMVSNFRKQVEEYIVPLMSRLKDRQRERLGLDSLKHYDEPFEFVSGNPMPKGDAKWIVDHGRKMYQELSKETGEFFEFMLKRELMDLEAKKGKESGGYCTYIEDYQSPFIFSNFNGTSGDIDVLTHEAGHAFQVYSSSHFDIPEYYWPTYESAEIHSMSMEFFTWPWMELFFKEDELKYKFSHIAGKSLEYMPYICAVDEFQHVIYENPNLTPTERKEEWKNLEKRYLPHRDYEENEFLKSGGFWQRQGHIFSSPFYYIDYGLAQVCAFQFWQRSMEGDKTAWQDYLHLCSLGGSKSFLGLIEAANLNSPFEEGTVQTIVKSLQRWLDSVDDKAL